MSYRPQLTHYQVITDGDMSGSLTSLVTIIQKISMLSYAYSWTGSTPVGTVSVQASNDYQLSADGKTVINAGTWNTLTFNNSGTFVTTLAVSGNSGNGLLDIDQLGAYAIRTIYTRVSGTGTLQVWINGKVA